MYVGGFMQNFRSLGLIEKKVRHFFQNPKVFFWIFIDEVELRLSCKTENMPKNSKKLSCFLCDKEFPNKSELYKHRSIGHFWKKLKQNEFMDWNGKTCKHQSCKREKPFQQHKDLICHVGVVHDQLENYMEGYLHVPMKTSDISNMTITKLLSQCTEKEIVKLDSIYHQNVLHQSSTLGEGSYGEVISLPTGAQKQHVLKRSNLEELSNQP